MIYTIQLSNDEIENLIAACWAQISSYCVGKGKNEEKPFHDLISKLEELKGGVK